MPKREIGALQFLEEHPSYDGRGVVVAIFDTGIDPGAAGLQTTIDGRPKILDLVDASGSGDVDTSTVRRAPEGKMAGLSGRELTVPETWRNPSGDYHLGLKPAFELYPDALLARVQAKRRERWDASQRRLETELRRALTDWDAGHADATAAERKEREDLQSRLNGLRQLQEQFEDPGPIYDCVVFHDGEVWRAVIDTDEDGDLAEETLLTDFRRERGWSTFDEESMLNFAVNVYEDGRVLSIVTDSGMHGTHVAGIVAAHYPDAPDLNGIAPGAQLISVKIGDTRLGGMETSTGFERGLGVVRRHGCDIINLSYGEPTTTPNAGRLSELLSEIVREDGVVFVSSAGNAGPALSTAGAPGGTTSALIGVGAYVSPAMMEGGYSMRRALPETLYTWSSRGPTVDGDWGVNISAPGGAISPVPTWSLQRSQLANGTSMASPNAAGAVALLLSGLKAEQRLTTPAAVRAALENTARFIAGAEVFTQGRGLIDVPRAFDWYRQVGEIWARLPRLEIRIPARDDARGVYLREPQASSQPIAVSVQVTPRYAENTPHSERVSFERRYRLETTAQWVESAGGLFLVYGGRSFDVRVDPTELEPGVHQAEVLGYDLALPREAGPAFRVPVTVIRALPLEEATGVAWQDEVHLEPGDVKRHFFAVPAGASWAELKLRASELAEPFRLVVHAQQLMPRRLPSATGTQRRLTLTSHEEGAVVFGVKPGRTLELCLAAYWSTLEPGELSARLEFHGTSPAQETVFLDGGSQVTRVETTARLRDEDLNPRVELGARQQTLHPLRAVTTPLGSERDRLPDEKQVHQLVLDYEFELEKATTVTPRFPALNGRLYDGEFGSQLWMLFNEARRQILTDDGWEPGSVRLESGKYRLRLHLRHERPEWLEKLKPLPLQLEQRLTSPLTLRCFAGPDLALTGGPGLSQHTLRQGETAVLWVAHPAPEELTKLGRPGETLLGTIRYERGEDAPSYAIALTMPPAPVPEPESPPTASADTSESADPDADALRDWQVERLKLRQATGDREDFETRFDELRAAYPDHVPLYAARLHWLDDDQRKSRLRSVVAAADEVLLRIDRDTLAKDLGVRTAEGDTDAERNRAAREAERDRLVDALYRKGRALAWMELPDESPEPTGPGTAAETPETVEPPLDSPTLEPLFEENFAELQRWISPEDPKVVLLTIRREWRHGRLGEALRLLQHQLEQSPTDRKLARKRVRLLEALGWDDWVESERNRLLIHFPEHYPPF